MSFSQSSFDLHLESEAVLVATCKTKDGNRRKSCVNLNDHIGNRQGAFDIPGENFTASAGRARLEGSRLYAELESTDGLWYEDSISLDAFIGNDDGSLVVCRDFDRSLLRRALDGQQRADLADTQMARVARPSANASSNKASPAANRCGVCGDWPRAPTDGLAVPRSAKIQLRDLRFARRNRDCPTCKLFRRI